MPRVHGLQEIASRRIANLSDNDPAGSVPKGILQKRSNTDVIAGLKPRYVLMLELDLGCSVHDSTCALERGIACRALKTAALR